MSVSGIGTSCTYLYDATTGKLSTKDGTKNNFVDYWEKCAKGGLRKV